MTAVDFGSRASRSGALLSNVTTACGAFAPVQIGVLVGNPTDVLKVRRLGPPLCFVLGCSSML